MTQRRGSWFVLISGLISQTYLHRFLKLLFKLLSFVVCPALSDSFISDLLLRIFDDVLRTPQGILEHLHVLLFQPFISPVCVVDVCLRGGLLCVVDVCLRGGQRRCGGERVGTDKNNLYAFLSSQLGVARVQLPRVELVKIGRRHAWKASTIKHNVVFWSRRRRADHTKLKLAMRPSGFCIMSQ